MGIEHKTKAFFAAISQWAEISLKNQITEELSVSLNRTCTDVNVDQRNEENFDRSSGNARVGYVST
ncbi:hypothetical protein [uncultured Nitrospira sp.]|uniref:hypothetical protein n=1 Tax=uncultured Nitrospira sp. TaxID=157176 RepID=UPI00313FEC9C